MCTQQIGGVDIPIGNMPVMNREQIIETLDTFQQRFCDTHFVIDDEALDKIKKKLSRCRREFDSNRFFVLVVGPVKSGKSTFVNILTRSSLSPTDVLECTALPTIIGKSSNPGSINCFIPMREFNENEKCELFDEIIDVLRGIESPTVLDGKTRIDVSEATSENVRNVVTNPGNVGKPMLATIGIEETEFMDNQVMLIDMPGLDGMDANDRDPLYRRMVQRADFIFFVQSSTSAINEATNDFLTWLLDNNLNAVPFRLIHNLHDSHYFLKADIRDGLVRRQLKNGKQCITDTFHITGNFSHYIWNFAKIFNGLMANDNVEENHLKGVNECAQEYRETEHAILQQMKEQRRIIKDQNNIAKSSTQLHETITLLHNIKDEVAHRKQYINQMLQKVEILEQPITAREINYQTLRTQVIQLLRQHEIETNLSQQIRTFPILASDHNMSGHDLKVSIDTMASNFSAFPMLNITSACYTELCNVINGEFSSTFQVEIDNLKNTIHDITGEEGVTFPINLDYSSLPTSISFAPNYYDIEEKKWLRTRVKYYTKREQEGKLNFFRQTCKNDVSTKINDYFDRVMSAVIQIRDQFIQGLVSQINEIKEQLRDQLNDELGALTSQDNTVDEMLQVLNV